MIRLYDTGAYLLNGTELIEDNADAAARLHQALGAQGPSKEEAAKNTGGTMIVYNEGGTIELKQRITFAGRKNITLSMHFSFVVI